MEPGLGLCLGEEREHAGKERICERTTRLVSTRRRARAGHGRIGGKVAENDVRLPES